MCTAVTSLFIEQNLRLRQEHSEVTTEFLAQELSSAKAGLDQQDAKLAAFKSLHGGELPEDEQTNLNLLTGLTSQLDASTQALARSQQDKTFAESLLSQQVAAWQASQTGQNPETLEQQLIALQTRLANLESTYTADHPDVIRAKHDIAVLQQKIADSDGTTKARQTKNQKSSLGTSADPTAPGAGAQRRRDDRGENKRTGTDQEADRLVPSAHPVQSGGRAAVQRADSRISNGAGFLQRIAEKARQLGRWRRTWNANKKANNLAFWIPQTCPTNRRFRTVRCLRWAGLAADWHWGLGIAFFLEMKDTSFKTERDVEFSLHLPVLAMVPAIEPLLAKNGKAAVNQKSADAGVEVGARA